METHFHSHSHRILRNLDSTFLKDHQKKETILERQKWEEETKKSKECRKKKGERKRTETTTRQL